MNENEPLKNPSLPKEFWLFIQEHKAWWLTPAIAMLLLVGGLIIFGSSSALSPFIYSLF